MNTSTCLGNHEDFTEVKDMDAAMPAFSNKFGLKHHSV